LRYRWTQSESERVARAPKPMTPEIAFALLYILHGFFGHIPYPDYYYTGPVEHLQHTWCKSYWVAAVLEGWQPLGEDEDPYDFIVVGSDGQTYICDGEFGHTQLDDEMMREVGLDLP
jgi:hypothetical protein